MKEFDEIILDVLNGEADEAELSQLEAWINESPENDQVYRKMLDYWYQDQSKSTAHRIWKSFKAKEELSRNKDISENVKESKVKKNLFSRFRFRVAAAVALIFATTSIAYFTQVYKSTITVETTFGEKKEFTLPDQTTITLNANSKVRYNKDFSREIWLEGEAFFSVAPRYESKEKFLVHTSDLTIEVLGTSFNVNSRREETKVFLEEGKIKLDLENDSSDEIVMNPGELLIYSAKKGGDFAKTRAAANNHTSWREGSATMIQTSLKEILIQMEEIYGVQFELENEDLLEREYTISVPVEDLSIAITTLENVLDKKARQKKDKEFFIE